jgi:type I restriction enzyme, S subunit
MELKPGYKQTEMGVIPEEWDFRILGEVATIATGSTPPTRDATNYGDEFLFVSPIDLGEAKYITRTEKRLSKKGFSISRRFPEGSVLFVCIGSTIGKAGIAQIQLTSNQQINAIFPSSDFSSEYLYYAISAISPKISALAGEQAVPIVNKTQFSETAILFAPVPEQRAIAAVLSDVDALIGALDQLIAKKRDLKQAAMQQLLTGQKRLPGFHGEWTSRRLGEIGECIIGLTYKPQNLRSEGMLVLRASNISEGALQFGDNIYVDMDVPERIIVRKGDILICVRNGSRDLIGKSAKIDERAEGMTFGAFMAVFRTPFHGFVYHQFKSDLIKRQIHEHLGATINQITNKNLKSFRVAFPEDEAEQTAIGTVLFDMDAEIAALEARRDKTRVLKQGMMQELLTGRIRLV